MPLHDHGADTVVHLVKIFFTSIIRLRFEPRTRRQKLQTCTNLNHPAEETFNGLVARPCNPKNMIFHEMKKPSRERYSVSTTTVL